MGNKTLKGTLADSIRKSSILEENFGVWKVMMLKNKHYLAEVEKGKITRIYGKIINGRMEKSEPSEFAKFLQNRYNGSSQILPVEFFQAEHFWDVKKPADNLKGEVGFLSRTGLYYKVVGCDSGTKLQIKEIFLKHQSAKWKNRLVR